MTGLLVVRAGWAVVLLSAPGVVIRTLGGVDETASRRVLRVLGVRHLLEAVVEARRGPTVRRAGAVVDLVHSMTAVGFGVADRRWRRPALADAAVASGFAVAGFGSHSRS